MAARFYRRIRIPIFWFTVAVVYVLATMPLPVEPTLGAGDKANHIAAFLTLTMLGRAAYPGQPRWKLALGLVLFGALIELTQAIPMLHRDANLADWIADSLAIAVGLIISLPFERRWPTRSAR